LRLISSPNVSFRVLEFWIVESLVHSLVSLRLVFFGGSYFKFLYPTVLLENLLLKSKQKQSHRPPSKDLKLLILAFLSELGRLWLLQWTPGFFSLASTIIPCELPSYVDMTLDSSPSSSSWESYYDSCTPTVFSSRCGLWNLGVEYCIDDVPIVVGCFWN
jgi:hypothetical protein